MCDPPAWLFSSEPVFLNGSSPLRKYHEHLATSREKGEATQAELLALSDLDTREIM